MLTHAFLFPGSLQAVHLMSGEVIWCLPEVAPVFKARGRVDGMDYKGEALRMELVRLNEEKEKATRRPADELVRDTYSSPVDLPGSVPALPVTGGRALQAKPPPAPHGRSAGSLSRGPKAVKEELIAGGGGHPGAAVSAWNNTETEELRSEQRRQQEDISAMRKELVALRQQPPPQAQQKPSSGNGCAIQ